MAFGALPLSLLRSLLEPIVHIFSTRGNTHNKSPLPSQIPSETFDYSKYPLDSGKKEIRLLRLLPGDKDDPLECILECHPLDGQCPVYNPISYVWGTTSQKLPLRCNRDTQLDISPNLHDALKEYREQLRLVIKHNHGRAIDLVWADAICINQADLTERKQQVMLMREIYSRGNLTWIWLGKGDEQTEGSITLLKKIPYVMIRRARMGDTRSYFEFSQAERKELGLPDSIFSTTFQNLASLLGAEWFSRVWVVQELVLSRHAMINCGSHQILWQDFATAVDHAIKLHLPISHRSTRNVQMIFEMEILRTRLRTQKGARKLPLLSLLTLARGRNATDQRDKVYALLGLADAAGIDKLHIDPDYSIGVEQVYRHVAERILHGDFPLDILSIPRVVTNNLSSLKLPSWVPDWSLSDFSTSVAGAFEPTSRYRAIPCSLPPSIEIHGDRLCVCGHFADHIERIGAVWTDEHQIGPLMMLRWLWFTPIAASALNEWEIICRLQTNSVYPPTSENIRDAYWQTLTAGFFGENLNVAKGWYEDWDLVTRSIFRKIPYLLLRWTGFLVMIPLSVLLFMQMLRNDKETKSIMGFRQGLTEAKNRRFFRTSKGYIGLAPALARKGDEIALCKGGRVPLVLRRGRKSMGWSLIGDCYVHGMMKGEAFVLDACHDIWIS